MNRIVAVLIACLLFLLNGCGKKYPEPGSDAVGFQTSVFNDENSDNEGYLTFEYNGRTYMPYGTQKGSLKAKDLDRCVGYIVQDGNASSVADPNDKDTRVYTLTADKETNFLMVHYIAMNWMNPPAFFRATDTRGKEIDVPSFIDDLGYEYWQSASDPSATAAP